MKDLATIRAKHAAYMRAWYKGKPGYKSAADRKYRQKYLGKIRAYDKFRAKHNPERREYRRTYGIMRNTVNKNKNKEYFRAYYQKNKHKWKESAQKPEVKAYRKYAQRGWGMKYRHGITLAQYEEILKNQGGVCAVCGLPPTTGHNKRLHVDHDHKTEAIRGLLCMHCNQAMERMDNCRDWGEKAAAYLRRFNTCERYLAS